MRYGGLEFKKEVFRTEILSTEVFIFNDGFLFIGTTDERKVLEIFELLIASMLLNNIPALTCTRIDFLKGKYDKEKKILRRNKWRCLHSSLMGYV